MNPMPASQRTCWCGHGSLDEYSGDYWVCRACGTLVSRSPLGAEAFTVKADAGELYSKDYWLRRQAEHHGLPDIQKRARLDLPERCTHWLQHLLTVRLPPARILEVGCGHGGYLALLNWAGFDAEGTEMSPWVADFARNTFGVKATPGLIADLPLAPESFDVLVLNDVLEHLPDPAGTLGQCARLLRPGGFFVIQTPEYKEHLGYADLQAAGDLFLKHMDGNNDEHLFLFSRRSAGLCFAKLGFPSLEFANPIYSYDMFFTASHEPLPKVAPGDAVASLAAKPAGRLVQALLDKAFESKDRWWAIGRLEAELKQSRPEQ